MTKRQRQDLIDPIFDLVLLPTALILGVVAVVKAVKKDRPRS